MRFVRVLLVIVAVVCFGVALSYPIRYRLAQKSNDSNMEQLAEMRSKSRQEPARDGEPTTTDAPEAQPQSPSDASEGRVRPGAAATEVAPDAREASADGVQALPEQSPAETANDGAAVGSGTVETTGGEAGNADAEAAASEGQPPRFPTKPTTPADGTTPGAGDEAPANQVAEASTARPAGTGTDRTPEPADAATPEPTPTPDPYYWDLSRYMSATPTPTPKATQGATPTPSPVPTPTPDRSIRTGPLPYAMKEKVTLDESAILPELRDIYALNRDLVGWITIPGTVIDYPVVQNEDSEFYLSHDFYGEENINGQIILDPLCDPYTPSYNLIISGHHMKNGSMFGDLPEYRTKGYWEKHRFLEFDSLMERKQYVIFAAFYSADYDEDEEGFRYNANLAYKIDVKQWLAEVEENQLYDTGVETEFGDEFITLTTCNRARHRNGRFVVVCRKIREGETFE